MSSARMTTMLGRFCGAEKEWPVLSAPAVASFTKSLRRIKDLFCHQRSLVSEPFTSDCEQRGAAQHYDDRTRLGDGAAGIGAAAGAGADRPIDGDRREQRKSVDAETTDAQSLVQADGKKLLADKRGAQRE